jgi:thioesterase domain-containing protein/acyl carrier protein
VVPVGRAVDHTRLYVLDRHGEPTPRGVAGEIHIGGAGVALGYFRRPELTAERFLPDRFAGPGARLYRTGDLGRFRTDGTLEFLGRLDHQLKIRGHRVEPGEIEAVLRQHPGIRQVLVVARPSGPGDLRLVAYYVPAAEPPDRAELRELCRRKLPEYMLPSFLVPLEALPLTPNGKLDRSALPAPLEGHAGGAVTRVEPRDELEGAIAAIWSEVLGTPVTSVRDDFFDLGGHSLLAARVFARIEERTRVALPMVTLLECPTVERLASRVRERRAGAARSEPDWAFLAPIRRGGARPPFFCVHGAGGHVQNLYSLGRHLAPDQPFYGIQARGVDGTSPPFGSIREMAEAYLAEVRAVQPRGPYRLAGYCGGALVAYEMALRLLDSGEQVGTLALIDALRPGLSLVPSRWQRWWQAGTRENPAQLWRRAVAKVQRHLTRASLAARVRFHSMRGLVPLELRDHWLTQEFLKASARYRPRRYPGRVSVFRARDLAAPVPGVGPDLGWRDLADGGVGVYEVPGDHHSLTREPNVQVLAALLEACLRAGEEPSGLDARAG